MTHLAKLISHCLWANQSWIDMVAQDTPKDGYLKKLMSHILLSERAWFQRIGAKEVDPDIWRVMHIDEMQGLQEEHVSTYARVMAGDIESVITYHRFSGEAYHSPVSDILLHLCTHGMHHRGQMTTHASRNGMAFPSTSFIDFCRKNSL